MRIGQTRGKKKSPPAGGKGSHNSFGREARPGDELFDEIG